MRLSSGSGKPLQQSDVTSRRAYHDSLNRAQRNVYSRSRAMVWKLVATAMLRWHASTCLIGCGLKPRN